MQAGHVTPNVPIGLLLSLVYFPVPLRLLTHNVINKENERRLLFAIFLFVSRFSH
jgi:hypothetical protein